VGDEPLNAASGGRIVFPAGTLTQRGRRSRQAGLQPGDGGWRMDAHRAINFRIQSYTCLAGCDETTSLSSSLVFIPGEYDGTHHDYIQLFPVAVLAEFFERSLAIERPNTIGVLNREPARLIMASETF
jgi:hypothetical protein